MNAGLRVLFVTAALGVSGAQAAAKLPLYAERQLKYPRYTTWDDQLPLIWSGWTSRFLQGGLVQGTDPSGAANNISEGQAYGMLLALWMGDQSTFNTVWSTTEDKFWNGSCAGGNGYYAWKLPWSGCSDKGSYAPDADQDIAGALIFASALVDAKVWTTDYSVSVNDYKAKAKILLKSIWGSEVDKTTHLLNSWHDLEGNGSGTLNPSYHTLGWYPIFKEFADSNGISGQDWGAVYDASLALLKAQPNSQYGMARNFSNSSGGNSGGGTSSVGTSDNNTQDMGFDAIRVPFRIALDAIWYPKTSPGAISYAKSVWTNGSSTKGVDITMPGYYSVGSASLIGWTENHYEKFMTRGMWGSLAVAVKDSDAAAAAAASQIGRDFGGAIIGHDYLDGEESRCTSTLKTSPCLNYYAQSLGLLGALAISGRAWNVWDDLKHTWTVPDTAAQILTALTATPNTVAQASTGTAAGEVTAVTATLSRAIPWHLYFVGKSSGAKYDVSGSTAAINVSWNSLKRSTGTTIKFTTESVEVRLVYNGVDTANNAKAKATITVAKNTGVLAVPVRGTGSARLTGTELLVADPGFHAGDVVEARLLDLDGRVTSSKMGTLQQGPQGLTLDFATQGTASIRILDLNRVGSSSRFQYILLSHR